MEVTQEMIDKLNDVLDEHFYEFTEKEVRFCHNYLLTGNKTKSFIDAGYSEKTARQNSWQKLKDPKIQAYIAKARAQLQELTGVTTLSQIVKLKKISEVAEKDADKINAIKELNRMFGIENLNNKIQEVKIIFEKDEINKIDEQLENNY